ncbi:hypothetical protein ASE08_08725 [Rhizobacter sp. Root16D2]|nr:hypothetical protein ASC88_14720 [Rhizobacter sp. Root29]KQW04684.1 hypothetical protein ASC98_04410 [Rhizobacter sp. Root1238]KRB14806.1 hypothetical protein ASE08_08725 [Rhizobacter sp. Root16D2]
MGACAAASTSDAATASPEARLVTHWILDSHDNQGKPFAVVDKKGGQVHIHAADGHLIGSSPALLGLAPGDTAIADIAHRTPASLRPFERTTPAGRFESQPGRNLHGEDIVWLDYAASLAIHRLRPAPAAERRAQRLASASPADNRISLGCVVVPVAFYEQVVAPMLGHARAVVYVLPEDQPVRGFFEAQGL